MKEIWRNTDFSNFIHLQTHWSTNPQHLSVSWANFLPVYWFISRNVLRRCKENDGMEGAVRVFRLILICKNPQLARMYSKRKPGSCGKVESFFSGITLLLDRNKKIGSFLCCRWLLTAENLFTSSAKLFLWTTKCSLEVNPFNSS